jgi:hypothetical protein
MHAQTIKYSALKKEEVLSLATTGMDQEGIVLSETKQKQKVAQ